MLGRILLVSAMIAVPTAANAARTSSTQEDKGRWICTKRPAAKPAATPQRKPEVKTECRWEGRVPAALDPTPVFIL